MAFKDLREYLQRLKEIGEIQEIEKEVDWNLEVGAIIRRSYDLRAPAPLFQKLKGYARGYRIFGAPVGLSKIPNQRYARLATALGMNPSSSIVDLTEAYIKGRRNLIKPILVSEGPCKEERLLGNDVDLYKFPAPFIHEGDGGRYLCTWHNTITKDPDTGWVNWGMYRAMIHERDMLGGLFIPFQHIGLIYYNKYEAKNMPMEFAIAIGTEPVSPLVSASWVPEGVNEVDVVGGLRGEPLELVKCETVDLEVPATSEIVIEGIVNPHERREEGPFGEYTGYRVSERAPRPVYHIKAITHRRDPIISTSCMGVPVDDNAVVAPFMVAAELLDHLRNQGYPVKMVYGPPEAVNMMQVVSTKVPYANYTKQLANSIWGTKAGSTVLFLVIVEDDVDATTMEEVIWAITTRCHPDRGIFKMTDFPGHALLPFLNLYERRHGLGSAVLFDCTWPKDWPKEAIPVKASFDVLWPKEIQEKVLKNWKEYGYSTFTE